MTGKDADVRRPAAYAQKRIETTVWNEQTGRPPAMKLIERYIFGMAASAFLVTTLALSGIIWLTQALREMDLMTSQGQTVWIFMKITGLTMPFLLMNIAPIALVFALIYTLNKLNGDSEMAVLSASGASSWLVLRPLLILSLLITLFSYATSTTLAPQSFRMLRQLVTQVRTDLIANIVKEGSFTSMQNITFHFRQRGKTGELQGLFFEDKRNKDFTQNYLAEEGRIVETKFGTVLLMRRGSFHRKNEATKEIRVVVFDSYMVDLSKLSQPTKKLVFKPRAYAFADLITPRKDDFYWKHKPGKLIEELHNRLSLPIYPLAFVLAIFAIMGKTQSNRQQRGTLLATAALTAAFIRVLGFTASSVTTSNPSLYWVMYIPPLTACLISILAILGIIRIPHAIKQKISLILDNMNEYRQTLVSKRLSRLRKEYKA